jgi:hypothetical protein
VNLRDCAAKCDGVNLARSMLVGLPRSSLVKSKSSEAAGVAHVAKAPIVAPVARLESPVAPPVPAPVLVVASPAEAPARESFHTKADSIEVKVESERAPAIAPQAARPAYESLQLPSSSELVERAVALGPPRMTWASIVNPIDPSLDEKRQPHVAERRARLTRVVKVTLGACLALCIVALGVSALSGGESSTTPHSSAESAFGKTVASKAVVPLEPREGGKRAKAVRRISPSVTTAAIVRSKHR